MSNKNKAKEILKTIMPQIAIAGDYAVEIQQRISLQPAKAGNNSEFSQALTDADLSIQNFIEINLLAKFPELNFFGEEYATSLNSKYFNANSELTVLLDPIDGTRFYKDKLSKFSIILSVVDRTEFLATIIYFPALNEGFLAIKEEGAFYVNKTELFASSYTRLIELSKTNRNIVTFNQPALVAKLEKQFSVLDVFREYSTEKICLTSDRLFTGECGALIIKHVQMIDGAAFAFILKEAGGVVCDLDGNPLPKISDTQNWIYPSVLAARNEEFAKEILATLATS